MAQIPARFLGGQSLDRDAGPQTALRATGGAPPSRTRDHRQSWLWEPGAMPVWQPRFYDFNVWTERKRIEKLRYMHRNPVKRELVASPGRRAGC